MEESLLRVRNVSKSFGGLRAVDGVNLDVKPQSIVGLVGPNGCGKSTLLSVIFGLNKADRGTVHFGDQRIDRLAVHEVYARGVVHAFQFPRLFFELTVLDNMLLAACGQSGDGFINSLVRRRKWQEEEAALADRAMELLELLQIAHLSLAPARDMSCGQQKLLEIGRSMMANPQLLLLDEPAAGVNPVLGRKVFEKLEYFRQAGSSFLVIEHRLEILMEFAHWIYVMDKGAVVIEGRPDDVINSPAFYDIYVGDR